MLDPEQSGTWVYKLAGQVAFWCSMKSLFKSILSMNLVQCFAYNGHSESVGGIELIAH